MTEFEQSTVVITGGGSGIGRSLALALARRGARVAVADVDFGQAETVAREIGNNARAYSCDVTERSQLESLAQAMTAEWGEINYVFANAGVAVGGSVLSTKPEEFDWLIDVNVRGVFSTMQVFVPLLIETASKGRPARFIVTGSENSLGVPLGSPTSIYTATKHAVLALADTLRRDLKGSGVGVSIFCPGVVDTRIFDARRTRQDRYGGRADMPPEFLERAGKAMAAAQKPDVTAELCLDGIARDEFMVITDPSIRTFAGQRHQEVETALDRLDAIISGGSNQ